MLDRPSAPNNIKIEEFVLKRECCAPYNQQIHSPCRHLKRAPPQGSSSGVQELNKAQWNWSIICRYSESASRAISATISIPVQR